MTHFRDTWMVKFQFLLEWKRKAWKKKNWKIIDRSIIDAPISAIAFVTQMPFNKLIEKISPYDSLSSSDDSSEKR